LDLPAPLARLLELFSCYVVISRDFRRAITFFSPGHPEANENVPRRDDIQKILIIGSGPIVIGQACEFDYSGTQACKALREEGYEVVLVNSNPATIMTDPDTADRTYLEPLTCEMIEKVIQAEQPDALLPTLGGQTALNLAMELDREGILKKYGVEMIGARADVIAKAEDRDQFKKAMEKIGLDVCHGQVVTSVDQAKSAIAEIGLPCVVRPSFTLGGSGSSIAYNREEFDQLVRAGLDQSPIREVLIEESVIGWKEYEMEVMRDADDNVVIICSIENFDPMGVHTGDSITVAPAQTLTDKEYQRMRDASLAVIREIGVETGGSNIQFAIDPKTGQMIVIEMNPRVSRSSALASKATGFPIAKIAAKLAVGYRLYELPNDITRETTACFEPTIDYVVTKVPRFAFEKFPEAEATLTTQMKSVGETMAIGRTFKESFQKALRGLEVGRFGIGCDSKDYWDTHEQPTLESIRAKLALPNEHRAWYLRYALKSGMTIADIYELTRIDPWFLSQINELVEMEDELRRLGSVDQAQEADMRRAKQAGFSDRQLATMWSSTDQEVRERRRRLGVIVTFKSVDTCAAEFEAYTPYYYSTYEQEDEIPPAQSNRKRVMILGGGPNRIGQGIEFDYCCCHACYALTEAGYETIMVNCNPETVSTDYDTSDRLYFEPLTFEHVMEILRVEQQNGTLHGVIVQFGGQTPLKLAKALEQEGIPILGTTPDAIDLAEDRERFQALVNQLGLKQPKNGIASTDAQALAVAENLGFPLVIRPSYVLGGRAMEIVRDTAQLERYIKEAVVVSGDSPVLLDSYLSGAVECDVDALSDGKEVHVAGIMQHIEEAGVHSGDSACSLPPYSLSPDIITELSVQTKALALALNVVGLMNVQFAVKDGEIYLIEVNPRASRTVPFVAKSTDCAIASIAARLMAGEPLSNFPMRAPCQDASYDEVLPMADPMTLADPNMPWFSVKEAVMPFARFPGVDTILGPEMRSTGEVMGWDRSFARAFLKAQMGAGMELPSSGRAFVSIRDADKAPQMIEAANILIEVGMTLVATRGTAGWLTEAGVSCDVVNKVYEGRPNIVDMLKNNDIAFVINTTEGTQAVQDSREIRSVALYDRIPYFTTAAAAHAAAEAMQARDEGDLVVKPLQG
jgi:carbamoyl-phosphate synthase large subunit